MQRLSTFVLEYASDIKEFNTPNKEMVRNDALHALNNGLKSKSRTQGMVQFIKSTIADFFSIDMRDVTVVDVNTPVMNAMKYVVSFLENEVSHDEMKEVKFKAEGVFVIKHFTDEISNEMIFKFLNEAKFTVTAPDGMEMPFLGFNPARFEIIQED